MSLNVTSLTCKLSVDEPRCWTPVLLTVGAQYLQNYSVSFISPPCCSTVLFSSTEPTCKNQQEPVSVSLVKSNETVNPRLDYFIGSRSVIRQRCFALPPDKADVSVSVLSAPRSGSKHYGTHEPRQPLLWRRLSPEP